jgi:signal peptidase I
MRCRVCGRDNEAERLFCAACATELVPGAAGDVEPPRARERRGRQLCALSQRLQRAWNDLGYSWQRVRPGWKDSIAGAKRSALAVAAVVPGLGHLLLGRQRQGRIMLGVFLLAAALWLGFIGTAFGALMVFVMVSVALTSVADCLRLMQRGSQARPRLSHVLCAGALVCGTYALGIWLLSLQWQRAVVNMNIVCLAPPGSPAATAFTAGDRLLVTRSAYRSADPARGEMVLAEVNGMPAIQRIIAAPGDTVEFSQGYFWINGYALDERYYPLQPLQPVEVHGEAHLVALPWSGVVADGRYLVWGMQGEAQQGQIGLGPTVIVRAALLGKAWLVYSPYRHRRIVDHENPAIPNPGEGEQHGIPAD